MKKLLAVAVASLSTACSPLLLPPSRMGHFGPILPMHAPPAPISPIGRWDEVMRLPAGSTIEVLTMDGAAVARVVHADGRTLIVHAADGQAAIARADVIRVDLVDLAGSEFDSVALNAGRGALLGAGAAAVAAAIIGRPAWPPRGALLRAGLVGGAVAGGQAAPTRRGARIVYLAPDHAERR